MFFCLTAASAHGASAESLGSSEADSIVRVLYDEMFSDFGRAQELLGELRGRSEVAPSQLNRIEGDMWFNRGNFFNALRFYKRALYDRDMARNDDFRMKMIKRVFLCYDHTHNVQRMAYYADMLQELAERAGDDAMSAIAAFYQGKVAQGRGEHDEAYHLFRDAIDRMGRSGYVAKENELCYYYVTLLEGLQDDNRNDEALAVLREMEAYLGRVSDGGVMDDVWRKDLEAHKAVLYSRAGMTDSARVYYDRFRNSPAVYEYDYTCIMPYLVENGLYDDMINLSERRKEYLESIGECSGMDMAYIYQTLGDAYMKGGEYREAALNYQRLDSLQEEMKLAESQSALEELSMNYEARYAELEHERRVARVKIMSTVVVALLVLLCVIGLVLRERHNMRIIMNKNRWMARTIERIQQREEVDAAAMSSRVADDGEPKGDHGLENENGADVDMLIYRRLTNEIVDRKLYLNANLSRDYLLDLYNIPKNKFSSLFRRYGNTTYTQFINSLRLEHAIRMMRRQPNYTVDAIAKECGIASTVTLYNLFSQQYGMTPTEYRKTLSNSDE